MNLSEAVASYVSRRRAEGSPFVSSEAVLKILCVHCGDHDRPKEPLHKSATRVILE